MVRALRQIYVWTAAFLLAMIVAGPVGALVVAVNQPTHRCHCPGHVPAPLQEPTFGPCGEEAKAVAAASPSALPEPATFVRLQPAVTRLAALPASRAESRLPLPETPPPRSRLS